MALYLDTPVQFIKGVGPRLGELLLRKGIRTVEDLIYLFPRAYEDRRAARSISSLVPDETVSLVAEIMGIFQRPLGHSKRRMYDVVLRDGTGKVHCKFFRVPYRGYFEQFEAGQKVRVVGKVTHYRGQIEFHHPSLIPIEQDEPISDEVIPIYPESETLSSYKISKLIKTVWKEISDQIGETLPEKTRKRFQLPLKKQSIEKLHFPDKEFNLKFSQLQSIYHRRLIFEEFFWLELFLAQRKAGLKKELGPQMKSLLSKAEQVEKSLPFKLTSDQKKTFEEILKDLTHETPMHRLVQGDVGSGKTLVALMSACVAIENQYQVTLMAPTEILTEQHYLNAKKWLEPIGIKCEMLVGSQTLKQKSEVKEKLLNGEIDICFGTHALIQEDTLFKNLGLVIVDEQHRFGVQQREGLKSKGRSPHFLIMTATPIPRTLSMTVYGDLDVSIIKEMPKGRVPITTKLTYENKRPQVMEFLKAQVQKGRQAYIVYPLVEESEKMDLKDALSNFELIKKQFPEFKVGLLHGKMPAQEKEEIMESFRKGMIQILVSTTVIEVGVDVPNANLMIIEHAERFGLSQLHQLRGRVGRGEHKSYCVLLTSGAISEVGRERLSIMVQTQDGFKISEADLEIRGPGEFLGTKQSGLPEFKLANIIRDVEILQQAREAAFEIVQTDPNLEKPEHKTIKERLLLEKNRLRYMDVG